MLMAETWENASGLPSEIASVFHASKDGYFKDLQLALVIPEYKVPLEGGTQPSQNDVFALLSSEKGLTALTVEGKAREDFGPTLAQWRSKVSEEGYRKRIDHILASTGLRDQIPEHIRYQLLHRTASAVIEANRFHCKAAAMIVQSVHILHNAQAELSKLKDLPFQLSSGLLVALEFIDDDEDDYGNRSFGRADKRV